MAVTQQWLNFQAGRARYLENLKHAKEDEAYAAYLRRTNALRKRQNRISSRKYVNTSLTLSYEQFKIKIKQGYKTGQLARVSAGITLSNKAAQHLVDAFKKRGILIDFNKALNPKANFAPNSPFWEKISEFYHTSGDINGELTAQEFFGS